MEEIIRGPCFLCGESCNEFSNQYTEPICEDCLSFKGLTRIEAAIGNKRRLKNKSAKAAASVEVSPSSSSPTQTGKRNSKRSVDGNVSTRKFSPGRKFISRAKRTETQMEKDIRENNESSEALNLNLETSAVPASPEEEAIQSEIKPKSNEEKRLSVVIPLSYKEIEICPNEYHKRNPSSQKPLHKLLQDQKKISVAFAQSALKALKSGLTYPKLFMPPIFKPSSSKVNAPLKLNLKRCGSSSGTNSRKKYYASFSSTI